MEQHIWMIEWDDSPSVRIPEIDANHKQFIFPVNGLDKAIVDRTEPSEITNRSQLIHDHAMRHFELEERLFRPWRHHDVGAHAGKHAEIVSTLRTTMSQSGAIP